MTAAANCLAAEERKRSSKGAYGLEMSGWKAVSLEQEKILRGSRGFGLGHQARFADPCFTRQQGDLPSATLRLIDQLLERGEVVDAVNKYWADNWLMKGRCHDVLWVSLYQPNYGFCYSSYRKIIAHIIASAKDR